jgi:hypothetical protein
MLTLPQLVCTSKSQIQDVMHQAILLFKPFWGYTIGGMVDPKFSFLYLPPLKK